MALSTTVCLSRIISDKAVLCMYITCGWTVRELTGEKVAFLTIKLVGLEILLSNV